MKKITILLIALMVISLGFLSGCNEQEATQLESLGNFEDEQQQLAELEEKYSELLIEIENLEFHGHDMSEIQPLLVNFQDARDASNVNEMNQYYDQIVGVVLTIGEQYFDHSLRLLTWNTFFLPRIESGDLPSADIPRAQSMAEGIKRTGADIVVLNEVFDEDARPVFTSELRNIYPYYVSKIDDTLLPLYSDLDDSGLMLFSRHPFTKQPNKIIRGTNIVISSNNNDIPYDVSFHEFKDTFGWDSVAAKGMGLVRIKVQKDKFSYKDINVGFTHMQSSSAPRAKDDIEGPNARMDQLVNMYNLMRDVFSTSTELESALASEEFYLLGDLNIDGNLQNRFGVANIYEKSEWEYHFNSAGFYSKDLKDGWAFGTSPLDVGQTHGDFKSDGFPSFYGDAFGQRLDYILHNEPYISDNEQMVLQHIRIAWELFDSNNDLNSDHHGVFADFNLYAPYCNPLIAYENPQSDQSIPPGIITHKGSMQWYRIDTPGTYSISVTPEDDVKYDIYEATDLSRPIGDYHGEVNEWGRKFVLPNAPFYIRVYSPDRTFTGNYQLKIHHHRGESKYDSIGLLPYIADTYTMPRMLLNPENAVWFDFYTDVADEGIYIYPDLVFLIKHGRTEPFSLLLVDEDEYILDYDRQSTYDGYTKMIEVINLLEGKYYLKALSDSTNSWGHEFTIEWRTTLTRFVPLQLKCIEQTDDVGDDELFYYLSFDETGGTKGGKYIHIADFDTDQEHGLDGPDNRIPSAKFVNDSKLYLAEDDYNPDELDDPDLEVIGVIVTSGLSELFTSDDDYFDPFEIIIDGFSDDEYGKTRSVTLYPKEVSGEYVLQYILFHE